MLGLVFALSSSVCWGVSDFMGGLQSRRAPLLRVMLVSQCFGLVLLLLILAGRGVGPPQASRLLAAAAAGVSGTIALTAFYRALAIGTMSIVAPISATGAAVPVIVGLAGGDRPAALQLVGIVTAIAGVVLASREQAAAPAERRAARLSVLLAFVAALGFGGYFVGMRSGARGDVFWAVAVARAVSVLGLAVVAVALRRRYPLGRRGVFWPLAFVGTLDVVAQALYATASRHGLLSVVAVAASLYPVATVVLARIVLGERVRRVQEVGIAAALTGVILIAAG